MDVAPFFSDPDGDALTYSASSSNTGIATASVSGSTVTVTGVAVGMATVTVTGVAAGGLTASLSASVTVEPANRAPVATGSVPAQSLTAGQSVQVDVAPFFSDPDGDALTYSASSSNTGIATASVSGSTVTVTGVAVGMATVTVTGVAAGGLTASLSASVTVEPANRAPVATGSVPAQSPDGRAVGTGRRGSVLQRPGQRRPDLLGGVVEHGHRNGVRVGQHGDSHGSRCGDGHGDGDGQRPGRSDGLLERERHGRTGQPRAGGDWLRPGAVP